MIDRRSALVLVATIFAVQRGYVAPKGTCPEPETLTLDLGAGACTIKQLRVQQGALSVDVSVTDLIAALKG